jgi:hypothetical protein
MQQQRRISGFLMRATALVLLGCSNPTAPSWQRRTYVSTIPNLTKAILAFGFSNPVATGVITTAADQIAVSVPCGTSLTALEPTLVHTGMSVSPASGQTCDFTSPVTYTVTGADGSTKAYTVTVTVSMTAGPTVVYALRGTGPAGGLVFYDKGSYSGFPAWRYLEAAPADQGTAGIQWYAGSDTTTGATGAAVGAGRVNTATIVASQGTSASYAATLCKQSCSGGFTDWFLPSKDELDLMRQNLKAYSVGGFGSDWYWSSSEVDAGKAWAQAFGGGGQSEHSKSETKRVRAVRAF